MTIWYLLIALGAIAELFAPERPPEFRVSVFPMAIPLIAGGLGALFGGASKGRAEGRAAEADYGLQRDKLNIDRDQLLALLYQAQQAAATQSAQGQEKGKMDRAGLDLQRRSFALNAPDTRLSQAIRGSMTANARDARATHPRANVVHFQGGPRPSMLNADARKLGELLARQALMAQLAGDKFDPVPDTEFPRLTPPAVNQNPLSTPPKPSGLDKFLGIAGSIGAGISALDPLARPGAYGIGTGGTPPYNPRGQQPSFINPNILGGSQPRY